MIVTKNKSFIPAITQWMITLLVFSAAAFAQQPDNYSISFITNKNGLSQLTNISMLQDSRGYMWIGSQDGINRYNGNSFLHFTDSFYFEACKAPKQVFGLVEDTNGDIWMGSREALFQYRHQRHTFRKMDIPLQKSSSDNKVIPFALNGNEIWFVKDDLSFMAIDISTQKVKTLFTINEHLKSTGSFVIMPQVSSDGMIWMGNGNELYGIDTRKGQMTRHTIAIDNVANGKDLFIKGLSLHAATGMLAVATDKGPVLFDTKKNSLLPITDVAKIVLGQDTWYVKAAGDCFWVSNDRCHLIRMSLDGKLVEPLFDKYVLDNERHRGSATVCIYIDKWNRLWLNATGEFIAIIDLAGNFMKKILVGKNGFRSGTMANIMASGNIVWASDTYLNKIDRTTGKVQQIYSVNEALKMPGIFCQLYFDSVVNRLWFNTSTDLCYLSLSDNRFVKTNFRHPGSTNVDYIRNFISMPGGQLLLARIDGVFEISRKDGTGKLLDAFAVGNINHLCKLSGNRFGLSLSGQPLHIYEYTAELDVRFKQKIPQAHSLMMISEDSAHGIIWAASELGLYKLHNQTLQVLKHFTVQDGMSNDFIYAAIPDAYGWVWCSTNRGIVAINGATDEIVNFDKGDYLQDLEFNNRSFGTDKDGYIYFGGVKGLNYFKPPYADHDTVQPRLVIEAIHLNERPYRINTNPDYLDEVTFDYAAIPLSIKVQALHLVKAASLKIIYRIKGQQEWTEIGNGEYIRMFNLSAGNYILELSYRSFNQRNAAPVRKIRISVLPPFYRTWWFVLLDVMLMILSVWYLISRRQRAKLEKLHKENEIIKLKAEQQLAVIKERERIIADLHDDVGATLSSMYIYGDLAGNVWHSKPEESRKMVEKISTTAKELMSRMGDIIWSMKPPADNKFTLQARLTNYSNELLAPKNIECEFNIDEKLTAGINHPDARKNILLIIKESINNIAKYSGASRVKILLKKQGNEVVLAVSDNGKGFDPRQISQGNGLRNIENRCRQLNGVFEMKSSAGNGVLLQCTFPIAIFNHTA